MPYGAIKKNFEVVMTIVRIDLTSRTSIYVFDVTIKRLTHNKVFVSLFELDLSFGNCSCVFTSPMPS